MNQHSHNRSAGLPTLEEISGVVEVPSKLPAFLADHRMSKKFQRQADEHHREVHGLARTVIQVIERAKKQDEITQTLKATTRLRKTNDLTALVLNALIEYDLPKDAYFLSCDKGVQWHLRDLEKDGDESPAFIKSLGGIRATYEAYRKAKSSTAKKEKKVHSSLEAAVLQACADIAEGDFVAIVARVTKKKRLELVSARLLDPIPETDAAHEAQHCSVLSPPRRETAPALIEAH